MILVGDQVFAAAEEHQEVSELESWRILSKLLMHPELVVSAKALKLLPLRTIAFNEGSESENFVYVFQKEFATAALTQVKLIGTDETTTCIGVAIHSPTTCLTSVGHLDFADDAALGLNQMVCSIIQHGDQDTLEVHLIGAYDDSLDCDTTANEVVGMSSMGDMEHTPIIKKEGYSWLLSMKVVEALYRSPIKFQMKTLCILEHNTCKGPNRYCCPIIRGFVMETGNGHIMPARFARTARAPDGIIRQLRVSEASSQPDWKGGLIDTYNTHMDKFVISPFKWRWWRPNHAAGLLKLSDTDLLALCSTSPHAETEDFVDAIRGSCHYICSFPDWRQTFPRSQSRVFARTASGKWICQLMNLKSMASASSFINS